MEAVPRLHMLWFALKSSPAGTSFAPLKKYIAEFYQEDPDSYSKEVFALETLRNQAMHPTKDGCAIMKRYYCQLHSLQHRFPHLADRNILTFTWKDLYQSQTTEITDMRYEMAAVFFNIAASHTQVGASVTRGDVDGMKLACTHFQCAAWAFGELREHYADVNSNSDFMTPELLVFMQQVSFAQAQECILEKSLIDNRKPNIVAKVTAQIVVYYGAALAALLTGGDDGPVIQCVESSVFKLWRKYVRFKISYLNCILYLYQGQHAEEQQKMGERVTLYQAAWEKLEEARKESKGLPDQKEINESLIFTADVVEAKRKNAKNENEFIYHEAVPELSSISAVQGANLVNGIAFSVTDPEVAGDDIFARLVPMKAHEASSMYSEEKAKLLRKYGVLIEDKDAELTSFMSSLSLENLNINEEKANKIPQGIVDRCAALNANKSAIPDLITSMSQLADICTEVELNLKEIGAILATEDREEREFQTATGMKRTPNAHITELTREFQKYMEAHTRAGESNDTLRKAMELHVNNLKILARPLHDIQQSVPKLSSELNTNEIFKDVKLILNKVNEMKAQRSQFHADLRIAVNNDDITSKIIAHSNDDGLQQLFDRELAKHGRVTQLIDQNLLAQNNILQALTDSYAKAAPILKTLADVKHKRESFFSSLAASYDVYEDLLAKSAKGLEFYKKISGNVQKLLTRLKSARDVQAEERQERLKGSTSTNSAAVQQLQLAKESLPSSAVIATSAATKSSHTPTLRDYLKAKNISAANIAAGGFHDSAITPPSSTTHTNNIPLIRPNPLGSETPSQAICSSSGYPAPGTVGTNIVTGGVGAAILAPNEPPPPYSLQQTQYYDPAAAGYTNPIYQQQQQNIAPPAYKLQASPNSQFSQLNTQFNNMHIQGANYEHIHGYTTMQQAPQNSATYLSNPQTPQQPAQSLQQQMQQNAQQQLQQSQQSSQLNTIAAVGSFGNFNQNSQTTMPTPIQQSQQMFPTLQIMNQPYSTMQTNPASNSAVNFAARSAAPPPINISASQPLYIATSNNDGNIGTMSNAMMPTQAQQTSSTMVQSSHVVNPAQHQLQAIQPLGNSNQMPQQMLQQTVPVMQSQVQPQAFPGMMPSQPPTSNGTTVLASSPSLQTPYGSAGSGSTKHPGYSYNPHTGQYEYGSGYQQATAANAQIFGQYTSATAMKPGQNSGTTDSLNAHKTNLATGFDVPIISHAKSTAANALVTKPTTGDGNVGWGYYTHPYGYHTQIKGSPGGDVQNPNTVTTFHPTMQLNQQIQQPIAQHQQPQQPQQLQPNPPGAQQSPLPSAVSYQQNPTYILSGSASIANTQTTKSAAEYASSPTQNPAAMNGTSKATQPATPTQPPKKKFSNIDLLTDIDITESEIGGIPPAILPEPVLKPVVMPSPPASHVASTSTPSKKCDSAPDSTKPIQKPDIVSPTSILKPLTITHPTNTSSNTISNQQQISSPVCDSSAPGPRESSYDNLSICSDLSSLDNFDFDSVSMTANSTAFDKNIPSNATNVHSTATTFLMTSYDPFTDDKIVKYFHKEVERYEKIVEGLNVKMLNGNTQLSAKWKELQDLLSKDANKRTTSIAKLFPEKNRSLDCLPYDHARVKLEKNTDDYINAAFIKDLGAGCPNFIIAQTPLQNTNNDFWSMVWSQKARTVICLHTPNEMLDPFWPQENSTEMNFDDFSIKCVKTSILSHCTEYNLKLSMHGADPIIDMSLLQIKAWTKSSPAQIIGIARNGLHAHQQRCLEFNSPSSPLVMNCLTGSDRSELLSIAICTILATQTKRPVLLNVVDVWYRICCQRRNAIRDAATLEQSMSIVLTHAHDVLNRRGIMTSYQMKIAPQVASKEKEEIKDPLNELDPLWKLK